VVATLIGCALAWAGPVLARFGLVVPLLQTLYNYAWFVGFFISMISYYLMMKKYRTTVKAINRPVSVSR